MQNQEIVNKIYEEARKSIDFYTNHPEFVTSEIEENIGKLFKKICEHKGLSDHSAWGVKWKLFKKHSADDVEPYETLSGEYELANVAVGNIILNGGANMMLKLICGLPDATAYDQTNAKIYVGTDSSPERADQSGVLAVGHNKEFAGMDSGYPQVSPNGRTAVFRATFGEGAANFPWNEMSLTNGSGVGSVALNRKQTAMGTKTNGIWSIQIEISVVEVAA